MRRLYILAHTFKLTENKIPVGSIPADYFFFYTIYFVDFVLPLVQCISAD